MQRHSGKIGIFTLITVCMIASHVFGATPTVPRFITYQGRLTDAGGMVVTDGPKSVRIIIWRDPVSVNPLDQVWNSGVISVTTSNGLFSVRLGESPQPAINPNDFLDSSRWIGVTVAADPEMTPRTRLGVVPYAFTAGSSAIALTTYNDAVGTDQIINGSVNVIDLNPEALPAIGQVELSGSTNSTTPAELARFTVNAPGAGYLYVQVTGQWWLDADATSSSSLADFFLMGLCDAPASSVTCEGTWTDYNYVDPDNVSANNSTHAFTITRIITLGSGGPVTLFLNAAVTTPSHQLTLYPQVVATAMFFPAALSVTNPAPPVPTSQRSGQ